MSLPFPSPPDEPATEAPDSSRVKAPGRANVPGRAKAPAEPPLQDCGQLPEARREPSSYLCGLSRRFPGFRVYLLAAFAVGVSSEPVFAEEGMLAAMATGPGGRSRAGDAVLDLSLADAGLMIGADGIRIHPGFPGGLPNDLPVASDGFGTRIIGFGLRLPSTAASLRGTDADGDRLRVVAVDAVSERGARVELDGNQIRYRPPVGLDVADSFGFVLADSAGDTATARFQVGVIPNPEPVDPETDRIRSRVDDAGRLELRFAAVPGQLYRIETATHLTLPILWEPLAEVRASADGRVVHSVVDIPADPVRYYRLVP